MLAPFLSVVIHGLLGTCSYVFKLLFFVFVGLKKFLFERCKCEKFFFCFLKEQVSKNHLPTRKKNQFVLMSFRQCYPTIDEWVASSLEF